MDLRLSPEQVALRESAARIVDTLGTTTVADLDDVERTAKLAAAVTAAGWLELRCAEDGGAPLASGVEVALVAEELGRGLADVAFLGPVLAADLCRRAGITDDVPAATVALIADLSTVANADEGVATAVDARGSQTAVFTRSVDGGLEIGSVATGSVTSRIDLTRAVASVDCADWVRLPGQSQPLDEDDLAAWTALALAVSCADLVGVMRGALAQTCDYATIRHQFGSAIGSFQAVQHLLADALVATEGSYSVALHAAWAADALPSREALAAARLAKAYCSRAARSVCETAVQVHGGIGNTWECLAHVYLRRALHTSQILGGAGASLAHVLAEHGIQDGDDGLR